MKILMATMPFQGHVSPALGVATRLSQRGHEVRWYTSETYKADVKATGATWVEMTHVPPSDPAPLAHCIRRFQAIAPAQIWELRAILKQEPADILLADPSVLAAVQLWAEGGPIYVMLSMLPLLAPTPDMPLILQGTIPSFEYPWPELKNLACIGPMLPPPPSAFNVAPEVDPSHWWHRLDHDRPLIHVTQGTIATDPAELVLPTLAACADLPVTVIATAPRGTVPEAAIPANAKVVEWVSHAWLLPRCAVFITNGGYSGIQRALATGVPMLVAGSTEDKPENAQRVAWAGNGIDLDTGTPTPAQIVAALTTLARTPRYTERAHELAGRCAQMDAPMTAALLLEHFWPHWQQERPAPAREYDVTALVA